MAYNSNNSSSVIFDGSDSNDATELCLQEDCESDDAKFQQSVAVNSSTIALNSLRIYLLRSCIEIIADGLPLNEPKKQSFVDSVSETLADLHVLPPKINDQIIKSAIEQVKASIETVLMATLKKIKSEEENTADVVMKLDKSFSNCINFEEHSTYFDLLTSNYKQKFYEIEQVGKGTYGSVYKVKKRSDGHIYAVKIIKLKGNEEELEIFSREVKQLGMLTHSNIVRYYDSWSELVNPIHDIGRKNINPNKKVDGLARACQDYRKSISAVQNIQLYIQMEFCSTTLDKWLENRNQKGKERKEDNETIMRQILAGIQYLHEKNVIHRDMKPQNILMDRDKLQIKITDFGLSRELYQNISYDDALKEVYEINDEKLTSPVGTKPYIAPEQMSLMSYDFKADVFSVGLIAYEIFHPMHSMFEKSELFIALKTNSVIDKTFQESYPLESDLVLKLAKVDPIERLTASEALNHKYFKQNVVYIMTIKSLIEGITSLKTEKDYLRKEIEKLSEQMTNSIKFAKTILNKTHFCNVDQA